MLGQPTARFLGVGTRVDGFASEVDAALEDLALALQPVGKVGFSAQLAGWSTEEGPLYGLGAIILALVLGWLGGAVLRRL